jgi:large subunit ribosomal protein L32
MAVPKKKTSPSRKGMRQAHHAIKSVGAYAESPDTGTLVRRHQATTEADGSMWYRGRQIRKGKVKPEAAAEATAE